MAHASAPSLLILHAVRLKGMADDVSVARRYDLDSTATREYLLDVEAAGWVIWSEFAGSGGWSLTERGRSENERRLAAELTALGATETVRAVYTDFLPLNALLQQACTDWQLRPAPSDPLAANDHTDPAWDAAVLAELAALSRQLVPLNRRLAGALDRFGGYDRRFDAALSRVREGDLTWVNRPGVDSCHTVWFELHEDLLATLGMVRGEETNGTEV
jgi:hypothetical protein